MDGEHEIRTGGERSISVDGKIILVPTLKVADFCKQYHLSDEIRQLLEKEKFETAGALLEVAESNLEKSGFKQGQIAEVKRALREFLSVKMVVDPNPEVFNNDGKILFRAGKTEREGTHSDPETVTTANGVKSTLNHCNPTN
ncbi:hypothetical protein B0H11DRAFT_1928429 [Mycena galericulata]|nr:hypothetical protein B0H11DRAFT_1928429 [Mycena galericulata]